MRTLIFSTLVLVACRDSATPPPVQQPTAARVSVTDPLSLVPAESDIVMKIDIAALRRSPLWAKYEQDVTQFIVPGFVGCGYNPLGEVSTVTLGIPMGAELGVFVVRGIDRDKTLRCLKTSKLETKTTATFDGEFVKLTNQSGNVNMITFVDAKTMVMQGSKNPTKETLTKALQTGAPLRNNREYLAVEQKLAPGAAFAMASRPGSQAFAEGIQAKVGAPVREFYATFHVTDVVSARVNIVMANAEDAAAFVENAKPQLEQLKPYVDRYDVKAQGDTITVDVAVTEAQIKVFADMAKAMMGSGN